MIRAIVGGMAAVPIRLARPSDHDLLDRIYRDVRLEIGSDPSAGYARDTQDERVLVAVDAEDRALGFVSIYEPERFVHHLYVSRPHRGHGLGTALLAAATARLAGPAWLKVDASNQAARAFYRRRGWVEDPPLPVGPRAAVVALRAPPGGR